MREEEEEEEETPRYAGVVGIEKLHKFENVPGIVTLVAFCDLLANLLNPKT
jgi:hypothetical protein